MEMKRITSADNPVYKAAAQLKQKKYRDGQKRYLIEGPNLIREARNNGGEIEMIFRSEDFPEEDFPGEEAGRKLPGPGGTAVPQVVMPPALFSRLSDTETPQGILAVVKKRIYGEEEFFSPPAEAVEAAGVPAETSSRSRRASSNLIVLDRLQDPGNIGAILRTADAAGYMGAILLKGTADIYSPKIVRSAAGSLFRLPVLTAETAEQAVSMLKRRGKTLICTAPGGSALYYDVDLRENAALIIGNEGNGACDVFLRQSDRLITIPMEGTVESLNAAVAAGILMYESVRQRRRQSV